MRRRRWGLREARRQSPTHTPRWPHFHRYRRSSQPCRDPWTRRCALSGQTTMCLRARRTNRAWQRLRSKLPKPHTRPMRATTSKSSAALRRTRVRRATLPRLVPQLPKRSERASPPRPLALRQRRLAAAPLKQPQRPWRLRRTLICARRSHSRSRTRVRRRATAPINARVARTAPHLHRDWARLWRIRTRTGEAAPAAQRATVRAG
jgi:hypothetical protein